MKLSRIVVACGVVCLGAVLPVSLRAQSAPKLTKAQRTTLEAVVTAVDRAVASSQTLDADWESHVLRASDGSHYVALSATASSAALPAQPTVLYVRLMSRRPPSSTAVERSAVLEWLKGMRSDPLPMRANGSMSLPQGEMPVGGPSLGRDIAGESSAALRLMTHRRENEQREQKAREAKRRQELERGAAPTALLPFEDFDPGATLTRTGDRIVVRRSLSAGPGDYDVYIAWAEPAPGNQPAVVRVITHPLRLPTAPAAELALSDVILADKVDVLAAPYTSEQQSAHPYALGALEASPARGRRFAVGGALNLIVQVINAAPSSTGKPDVELSFRVSRLRPTGGEEPFANLPPQRYSTANLPADFDVLKGHPIFGAVRASLAAFPRGAYRVVVTATDKIGGRSATGEARFTVAGTPESLLREAPTPGQAFRREMAVTPAALAVIVKALTPPSPSAALAQTLSAAATGRFAALVQDAAVDAAERPVALALRGLGLYGLGDSARTVATQLQQAIAQGSPAPPVLLLLGASYALAGDDKGAIAAWNQSRDGGIDDASVAVLLVDAYMRQGDIARAAAMAQAALDSQPENSEARRGLAGTLIATRQYERALALLDAAAPADPDSAFLILHALYAGIVEKSGPGATEDGRTRFLTGADAYIAAGERQQDLVRAWRDAVAGTPGAR